jgi:hypothetical protein
VVCVSYRIGKEDGELLVARGGLGGPKHPSIRKTSYKGTSIISWATAGQTYTIATTKEGLHSACVLCHMDGKRIPTPPSAG